MVDAVIALAAIGDDKRDLWGTSEFSELLFLRYSFSEHSSEELLNSKKCDLLRRHQTRPPQFESPSLVASWFAQSTFYPPFKLVLPKSFEILKIWKMFLNFSP